MHAGSHYTFKEVILWTRREIYTLAVIAIIPTFLYSELGWKWIALPWLPIALLGTAVAFVVGFKNNASYDRLWEARKVWGAIVNTSRSWGISVKDYVTSKHAVNPVSDDVLQSERMVLVRRHLAWLTALRHQLREPKVWESTNKPHSAEYRDKWFRVDERDNKLEDALRPYLSESEFNAVMKASNRATQVIALQSAHLRQLLERGLIEDFRHMELQKHLTMMYDQQGASERIKNFPYPRQYATINLWFIKIFVLLLPLGMLHEFDNFGEHLVWLNLPFSVLSGWIFTTMERIGEASESPFEGSANDVPITAISRTIEIDLLEMFGATDIPTPLKPQNNILT
jgi:ion channel-forming bestrophin family protein